MIIIITIVNIILFFTIIIIVLKKNYLLVLFCMKMLLPVSILYFVSVLYPQDPKEYLPFLNQMRRLEENYRKYSIDLHLKKYSTALEHISKCGKLLYY